MKRRALLATVAATAAFSGCSDDDGSPADTSTVTPTQTPTETPTESPTETKSPTETETESPTETKSLEEPGTRTAEDLPPECPVSTFDEFESPGQITEESILEFVREYERAYLLNPFPAPPSDHLHVQQQSANRLYHGYAVDIFIVGGFSQLYGEVHAEAIPSDRAPHLRVISKTTCLESSSRKRPKIRARSRSSGGWGPSNTVVLASPVRPVGISNSSRGTMVPITSPSTARPSVYVSKKD